MLTKINDQEQLFNYYLSLQSEEFKEGIIGCENFYMKSTLCSIKVMFKNGEWLRVYKKLNGEVEWY